MEISGLPISDPEELKKLRLTLTSLNPSYRNCRFEIQLRPDAQLAPDGDYPPSAFREVVTMRGLSVIRDSLYEDYRPRLANGGDEGLSAKIEAIREKLVGLEKRFSEYKWMIVAFNGVANFIDRNEQFAIDGRAKPVEIFAFNTWHLDQPGNQNYIPGVKKAYDTATAEIEEARTTLKKQLSAAGVPLERIPLVLRYLDFAHGGYLVNSRTYSPHFSPLGW